MRGRSPLVGRSDGVVTPARVAPDGDGVPPMLTTVKVTGKLPLMSTEAVPLLRSPLHERHVALGAKFAAFGGWEMPLEYAGGGLLREHASGRGHGALRAKFAAFGGWEMPLEYAGGGVLREHTSVREAVGVFDVSHLGKARVAGPGAADFVNSCLSNDLGRIGPGRAQYTLCCDDATGGVVDDIIAYLIG